MKKLLIVILSLLIPTLALAGSTQTNVSGSNTAIEGGYTGGATTCLLYTSDAADE